MSDVRGPIYGDPVFQEPASPAPIVRVLTDAVGVADPHVKAVRKGVFDVSSVGDDSRNYGGPLQSEMAAPVFADPVFLGEREALSYVFRQVTDRVGATDSNAQRRQKFLTDPVGATDVNRSFNGGQATALTGGIFGHAVFGLDGNYFAPKHTEPVGLSDTVVVAKTTALAVTDTVGVTDTEQQALAAVQRPTDAVGGSDSTSQAFTVVQRLTDGVGAADSHVRAGSYNPQPAEAMGVSEATNLVRSIVLVFTEVVQPYDSTSTAQTFVSVLTEAITVVDAHASTTNLYRELDDDSGLADSPNVFLTYVAFIQDQISGLDPPVQTLSASRALTDAAKPSDATTQTSAPRREAVEAVGYTDSTQTAYVFERALQDGVAAADATERRSDVVRVHPDGVQLTQAEKGTGRRFDRGPDIDNTAISDTVVYYLRTDGNPAELHVVDDDTRQVVSAGREPAAEPMGVVDGLAYQLDLVRTPTEPLGVSDSLEQTADWPRGATDDTGLSDTAQRAVNHYREVSDAVGATDTAASALTARAFIFDQNTLGSWQAQGAAQAITLTDAVGASDAYGTELRLRLADFGIVFSDGYQPTTQTTLRSLADDVAVPDGYLGGQTFERVLQDSAGLADALVQSYQPGERDPEPVGVTDAVVVTLVKAITEDVAVLEPGFGSTTNYRFEIVEPVTTADEMVPTTSGPGSTLGHGAIFGGPVFGDPVFRAYLARSFYEHLGLRDVFVPVTTYPRGYAEATQVLDSTHQAVTHVRRLTDEVGTSDEQGSTLYRSLLDDTGMGEGLYYLNARMDFQDELFGLDDPTRQAHGADRRPLSHEGISDDVDQLVAQARTAQPDPVGLSDSILVTRIYELADDVGVTDPRTQVFTHRRLPQDGVALSDKGEFVQGARQYHTEPVGVRDSLNVELIPPGLIRYGHLRPVFPGKPYVWSIYARVVGTHPSRAALEVRWHNKLLQEIGRSQPNAIELDAVEPRRIDLREQAPVGAYYASLYFGHVDSKQNDEIDWDSAQWEQGEVPTAYGPKPDEILPGAVGNTMLALGAVSTDRVKAGAITNSLVAVGAIDTRTLATDAVTNDKMAPDSVNTEQLVVGSVVAGAIAAGAIVAGKISANAITAGTIAADVIGAREIVTGGITAKNMAADSITTNSIAAGAVTAGEIAANAIYAGAIQAGAVNADKIAANSIETSHIKAGSVHANRIQAETISAAQIGAEAIVTRTLAAEAIIAEKIAAGAITATHITTDAIVARHIRALEIKADKIDANAIRSHHIQADAISAVHITAGSIGADEISATAITGKTITGGLFQTGVQGEDRIVISDVQGNDQYGRNYRDVIQWRTPGNAISSEIRGYLGDIGINGIQLNGHIQLGHKNGVIYQTARRSFGHSLSTVRMGNVEAIVGDNGQWSASIPALPTTVTSVVAVLGDFSGSHTFGPFAVTGWGTDYIQGRVAYIVNTPDMSINVSLNVSKDANGFVKDVSVSSASESYNQGILAYPGRGTRFAIRYYAECGS